MQTEKRRDRSPYSFANINLLGKCNVDCFFCLGKDLSEQFGKFNHSSTHFSLWPNFDKLMAACREHGIKKIYLTGQNVDALQYLYIAELIFHLRKHGFTTVGCRTNGMLAMQQPVQIFDTVSYSVHTLQQHTQDIIFGGRHYKVPNWKAVFEATAPARVRAAIVLNRYNRHEMYELLNYLATTNADYIQVRKVCTDTRLAQHEADMAAFEEWVPEFDRLAGGPRGT